MGDDDLIALNHTCSLYELIPDSELAIVPGASHALPIEQPDTTARLIIDYLSASASPQTLVPVRRTSRSAS